MLNHLREHTDNFVGIMSSHPAACTALSKVFGRHVDNIDLDYIAQNAPAILQSCPIECIRNAKPAGTLFQPGSESIIVSAADTNFEVDHPEPNQALEVIKKNVKWPLGELAEAHELLLLIQHKRSSDRTNIC